MACRTMQLRFLKLGTVLTYMPLIFQGLFLKLSYFHRHRMTLSHCINIHINMTLPKLILFMSYEISLYISWVAYEFILFWQARDNMIKLYEYAHKYHVTRIHCLKLLLHSYLYVIFCDISVVHNQTLWSSAYIITDCINNSNKQIWLNNVTHLQERIIVCGIFNQKIFIIRC